MNVEMKWPPIIFLGCDNGAFHRPNASTQLAPKGAINHAAEVIFVKRIKANIVKNPPISPVIASFTFICKGLLPFPFIFENNEDEKVFFFRPRY